MEQKTNRIVPTPYDDVFRTLLNDCRSLIIPVINEIFGCTYTGNEQVVFAPDIHFLNQQDGREEKRITDSSFRIVDVWGEKKFLCECQSVADNSMLVRIFEYATQTALDQGTLEGDTLNVDIPHCAVLFLRCNRNTPEKMRIAMKTPGGSVSFDVPVMKTQKYSVDEIFEKRLLFLLPFYIFSHESRFGEYEGNPDKLEMLKKEYADITERLNRLVETGAVSVYMAKTIIEMSEKVVENIARKYGHVKEGVKSVMGGRILEYEAKTILNEGRMEQAKETATKLHMIGMDEKTIAEMVNVSIGLIKEWFRGTPA